jgi:hypothetical protein
MSCLVPIIIHSQHIECISGIEKYFETTSNSPCIKSIMTDGKNLYIEFNPFKKELDSKMRKFVSIIENGIFEYNNKTFKITSQYYDL